MQQAASSTWNLLLLMMIRLGSAPNNARVHHRLTRALSPYRDMDSLHAVVAEAGKVPGRLHGLRVPGCVRCATGELMLARRGVPGEAPELPAMRILLGDDGSRAPMTVDAEFHPFDRRCPGPGATDDLDRPGLDDPPARIEIRDSRRHHQRIHAHQAAGLSLLARHAPEMVAARLLQAVERPVDRLDGAQPFHARHAVPARHDEPQRRA